jgi:hypothetical protein
MRRRGISRSKRMKRTEDAVSAVPPRFIGPQKGFLRVTSTGPSLLPPQPKVASHFKETRLDKIP